MERGTEAVIFASSLHRNGESGKIADIRGKGESGKTTDISSNLQKWGQR